MKKNIIIKRSLFIVLLFVFTLTQIFLFNSKKDNSYSWGSNQGSVIFDNEHDDTKLNMPGTNTEEEFIKMTDVYSYMLANRANQSDSVLKQNLEALINNRAVSISNADELYYFANSQSINFNMPGGINTVIYNDTIEFLLNQTYKLLNDIDYSVKRSQKFVPIGTNIKLLEDEQSEDDLYMPFTGIFDGNGFEIKNLYLAEYSYITTTIQDENESSAITVALFKHYAMFSTIGESAVIKNFVLNNPILEVSIMDSSSGLFNTAILAGDNKGKIENVGVIDEKKNQAGLDNSGIIFNVAYPSSEVYRAAGFVYNNSGSIHNSYLVTDKVIANQSQNRFNNIYPFVYSNNGSISNVNYNNDMVLKNDSNKPTDIPPGINKDLIKSDGMINDYNLDNNNLFWNFYKDDGYPSLKGLVYDNSKQGFIIRNEYDLLYFSYMISLNTIYNGKNYNELNYYLTNNINMKNITGYKTPNKDFKGKLSGKNGSLNSDNYYIFNLKLSKSYVSVNNYYLGLLSTLSGEVSDLNFINNEVEVKDGSVHYGKVFHVGMIAGKMTNGDIHNIYSSSNIHLGADALGLTYAGGLVGLASGTIDNVNMIEYEIDAENIIGIIDGGLHNFNNHNINGNFYVGGIVGRSNNTGSIKIKNSLNETTVRAVGSIGTTYQAPVINSYAGGIIGESNNTSSTTNEFLYVTNKGLIDASSFVGKTNTKVNQFIGGIFASVRGNGFKLNSGNNVLNGRLQNDGLLKGGFINTDTKLFAGGIGVMNTTEDYAKISYLINNGKFEFDKLNYQTNNNYIYYGSTIVDNSDGGVELSRAYNTNDIQIKNTFFNNVDGINTNNQHVTKISFFYTSTKDKPSRLLYVENRGNLTVLSNHANSNLINQTRISNITQSTRVDFINVVNSGNILVDGLKMSDSTSVTNGTNHSIYVSAITWILPYDNRSYKMDNVLNEGNITTSNIGSNTNVVGNVTGPSFSDRTFRGDLDVKNLYVSGLVNLNVGEITNSFNIGNITSGSTGITGTANTFVGGISTFNYNLIKDAANGGLIEYTNTSTSSVSHFAATIYTLNQNNNSTFGGISITYTGGIVLGGIVSALGDLSGTELNGHKNGATNIVAKVIDTVNNGDIYGKSREYVRSGGIVGIALSVELASGTYLNTSVQNQITAGPFTTAIIGSGDPVGNSLLSNGLNYGNIYSVTSKVGSYASSVNNLGVTGRVENGTNTSNNTYSNSLRPGIHAAAGGVIGYGLTRMTRMINHGTVSSTDVAGGIVGATYILGGSNVITQVTINTAVHYGKVKAIKTGEYNSSRIYQYEASRYDNFNYIKEEFFNGDRYYKISEYDKFINYKQGTTENLDRYQNAKRGFGGIFGRLQRGNNGTMESSEFDNIMNMDGEIDFVGRVDSNTAGSLIYYRLKTNQGSPETYFSAKRNDTSFAAFTGWKYSDSNNNRQSRRYSFHQARIEVTFSRNWGNSNTITGIKVIDKPNSVNEIKEVTKTIMRPNTGNSTSQETSQERITYNLTNFSGKLVNRNSSGTESFPARQLNDFGFSTSNGNIMYGNINVGTIPANNNSKTIVIDDYTYDPDILFYDDQNRSDNANYTGSSNNAPRSESYRYHIQAISDNPNEYNTSNIFHESFPLMQEQNSEFIYPVQEDALANRFRAGGINAKPYGMYVLASSTGSKDGSSLPTNIDINKLFKLKEDDGVNFIDLNNVTKDNTVSDSDSANNLIEKYTDMFQLSFNDKSEILPENELETPLIGDIVFYDPEGNSPTLAGGVINHTNRTITYRISKDAFNDNLGLNYEIKSNKLSRNAVITNNDPIQSSSDFKTAYDNRVNDIIVDDDYKFNYNLGDVPATGISFTLKVYSELSVQTGVYSKYVSTYTIIIEKIYNQTISTNIFVNGVNQPGSINIYAFDDIEVRLTDNNTIPKHHKPTVAGLYYIENGNRHLVDESYYSLTLNQKINTSFGFNIILSEELKSGDYEIDYGVYDSVIDRKLEFVKLNTPNTEVTDINYNEFSMDLLGNELEFIKSLPNFITYIKFGNEFNNVTTIDQTLTINTKIINGLPIYVNDIEGYELSLDGEYILTIKLTPFQTLNSATIKYEYDTNGKKVYILNYQVSEASSTKNIEHRIVERETDKPNIYLNNNLENTTKLIITREALLSVITLDYHFSEYSYNDLVSYEIYKDNVLYIPLTTEIDSNYLEQYFNILVTGILEPGNYTFNMYITREGNRYDLSSFDIEKLKGSSAYLVDIKYTEDDDEMIFEYPVIRSSDSNGIANNDYDTRIFYDGIDYVGADNANIKNFRIDGKVSDILLESYSPRFTLPYGATIRRYDTNTNTWTDDLNADYIGDLDELVVVKYRITSEDGLSFVDYHVTTTDVKYNLTLRFEVFFRNENGNIIKADDVNSPIKNSVVLISSKNMKLDGNFQTSNNSNVSGFPTIKESDIIGINNQSVLYYFVGSGMTYRFGRNISGSFNFNIQTPKYSGAKNNKQVPGERYNYSMYMMQSDNGWDTEYKLPDMKLISDKYTGLHYFVYHPSQNPITRKLAIVIDYSTKDGKWGLNDDFASWD